MVRQLFLMQMIVFLSKQLRNCQKITLGTSV